VTTYGRAWLRVVVTGRVAKACDWRIGERAKRLEGEWAKGGVGFVFSGEAEIQDSLGRSPRNRNKTGDQP
jgi:hypothetical protein